MSAMAYFAVVLWGNRSQLGENFECQGLFLALDLIEGKAINVNDESRVSFLDRQGSQPRSRAVDGVIAKTADRCLGNSLEVHRHLGMGKPLFAQKRDCDFFSVDPYRLSWRSPITGFRSKRLAGCDVQAKYGTDLGGRKERTRIAGRRTIDGARTANSKNAKKPADQSHRVFRVHIVSPS